MHSTHKKDINACITRLRSGSLSFYTASLLLPKTVRQPAAALYGFCRIADDAIDEARDPYVALADLRQRLDAIYEAKPVDIPEDRAFAYVVQRYAIPREFPEALLEGFAWDASGKNYETLADLHDYAVRVAGTVGAMMAIIMGVRSRNSIARACELGMAMQLTNIARDIGEDAERGRLYIPSVWLDAAGIDAKDWLQSPDYSDALGRVIQRLLDHADKLYRQAETGISHLPVACRPAIQAANIIYSEIGRELERRGLNSIATRSVVSLSRKSALLGKALVKTPLLKNKMELPVHDATQFLLKTLPETINWTEISNVAYEDIYKSFDERVESVLDLFIRLEQRDQGFST
ncbi:MAG: phytoene/squalene synthase family protein, partial [Pseudomonadota bacterium]